MLNEIYNINIAFVILHYNVIHETIGCIESIKRNIDTNNYSIVVVDNKSPNGSGPKLEEMYHEDSTVKVILLDNNIGFAKGNNAGISYARENLDADFVCCLNNDTLLEQNDFAENLIKVYELNKPAVIGPKVILKDGTTQKHPSRMFSLDEYKNQLRNWERVLHKDLLSRLRRILADNGLVKAIIKSSYKKPINQKVEDHFYDEEHVDILLHGCCLIFSPLFFEHLTGFCPETFLYNEEEILFLDLKKNGLHNLYTPSIQIRHLENAATDSVVKTTREKMEFLAHNKVESLSILISKMSNN